MHALTTNRIRCIFYSLWSGDRLWNMNDVNTIRNSKIQVRPRGVLCTSCVRLCAFVDIVGSAICAVFTSLSISIEFLLFLFISSGIGNRCVVACHTFGHPVIQLYTNVDCGYGFSIRWRTAFSQNSRMHIASHRTQNRIGEVAGSVSYSCSCTRSRIQYKR